MGVDPKVSRFTGPIVREKGSMPAGARKIRAGLMLHFCLGEGQKEAEMGEGGLAEGGSPLSFLGIGPFQSSAPPRAQGPW